MRNKYCARYVGYYSGMAEPTRRDLLDADPTQLRAIAHPLRNRILSELTAAGSGRAADLAHVLGVPANQVSFHLRQLAKYGLIEDAPELARDGRDRVWRPAHRDINVDPRELAKTPGGTAAVKVFHRVASARAHQYVDEAFTLHDDGRFHQQSEGALRLTKDEAKACAEEIRAVVDKWQERGRDAAADDERQTYVFMDLIIPMPDSDSGASED